jgi:hypothetical protein
VAMVLPRRVAENIDHFTGRAWLLPKLLEWWDQSNERLFLLTGGPGTGKSMLVAWLAGFGPPPQDPTAHEQLTRLRSFFKAAHFCQASSRNISPQAFAESMASQLSKSVKGFSDALAATVADRVTITANQAIGTVAAGGTLTGISIGRLDLGTLGDELSFDRALTQPLKILYDSGHSEPMLLLVDALDEAQTYTGVTLPDLLSSLSDLPAGVRILAVTRDEPGVLKFFRDIPPFDLINNAPADVDDVRVYAIQRLSALTAVLEAKRSEFADRLSRQAAGLFLYAAMVLDELLQRTAAELPDLATYPLPKGLSGLYQRFLNRVLGKDEQVWPERYRPLLGVIAVAQGDGLTTPQLASIIERELGGVGDTLRRCKQYLGGKLPDGPFRPFHKSFADFLLEDKDNIDYHIDARSMHRLIANHYWSKHRDEPAKRDDYKVRDASAAQGVNPENIDDYGLHHLALHLALAGLKDELDSLLDDRWARIKESREGTLSGFLSDVRLAWQFAEAADNLDLQVRYALFEASVHSQSCNLPPSLLRALLQRHVWTPAQALGHTKQISNVQQRAVAITILAEWITPDLFDQGYSLALAIPYDSDRIEPLSALIARAPESVRSKMVCEVIAALGRLQYDSDKAWKLSRVAAQLSQSGLTDALDLALAVRFDDDRASAIAGLVPYLPESCLPNAKKALWFMDSDNALRDAVAGLIALAHRLSDREQEAVWQRAVAMARGANDEQVRIRTLTLLAGHLPDCMLPQVFEAVYGSPTLPVHAELVAALLPRCRESDRPRLLELGMRAVDQMGGGTDPERVRRYIAFLPFLAPEQSRRVFEIALAEARDQRYCQAKANALALLIPHAPSEMTNELQQEALEDVRRVPRSDALIALAECVPTSYKCELVDIACGLQDENSRAESLAGMARQLSPALLLKVLSAASIIVQDEQRLGLLDDLAPWISADMLPQAMAVARAIRDHDEGVAALLALCEQLPPSDCSLVPEQLLETVTAVIDPLMRIKSLHRLAKVLPEPVRTVVWSRLLEALRSSLHSSDSLLVALADIGADLPAQRLTEVLAMVDGWTNVHQRGQALLALAPVLPAGRIGEAIEGAFDIWFLPGRAEALISLFPRLSDFDRRKVLRRILDQAQHGKESECADVIRKLAPHLPPDLVAESKTLADSFRLIHRESAVVALLPYLPVEFQSDVSRTVVEKLGELSNYQLQIELLEALADGGYLSGQVVDKALDGARTIRDHGFRARALVRLLPNLSPDHQLGVAQEALAECGAVTLPSDRLEIVIGLVSHLSVDNGWKDLFWTAYTVAYARDRARALLNILPVVSPEERGKYLADSVVQGAAWVYERQPARGARERAEAWAGLLDNWRQLGPADARIAWARGLRALASRPRPELLLDLAFFAPILRYLGGVESVGAAMKATQEARRMWP